MLTPRLPAPNLKVNTLKHGSFDLATETPSFMSLLCFYRGLHCPVCATYLKELQRLTPEFEKRGVNTLAISTDTEDRALQMADKMAAQQLRFGFGLTLDAARQWGLYISRSRGKTSIGIEEPELFSEPGVFLVKLDRTLLAFRAIHAFRSAKFRRNASGARFRRQE